MTLKVGDKAPLFKGRDQDGNELSLESFRGKKVVLYFYPNDDTETCTKEACNLRDNHHLLKAQGYTILGVSSNDEASHRKFIKKYDLPFTLIADTDISINELYGVWIEKSMYGRTFMGTARVTFLIDEKGIITEIISNVISGQHAEQILNPGVEIKRVRKKAEPKTSKTTKATAAKVASKGKKTSTRKK